MEPMEYYVHHVPGRLRVKIPALKHRSGAVREIQELLDLNGVSQVQVKSITGSVVVHYEPELIQPENLLQVLSAGGYYDNANAVTLEDKMRTATSQAAAKVGKALFGWGVSKALEANGLSLLAVLI